MDRQQTNQLTPAPPLPAVHTLLKLPWHPQPVNLIPLGAFACNSPCLRGKSFGSRSAQSFLGFLKSPGTLYQKVKGEKEQD